MMASVPSFAFGSAPDTGASTSPICLAPSATARACVPAGSEELMSMTSAPGFSAGSASITTSRTTAPSGSMVSRISAPFAAARTDECVPLPRLS